MKKYIALIALLAGFANAETIQIETPINVGGTISSIEVGGVQYNADGTVANNADLIQG